MMRTCHVAILYKSYACIPQRTDPHRVVLRLVAGLQRICTQCNAVSVISS